MARPVDLPGPLLLSHIGSLMSTHTLVAAVDIAKRSFYFSVSTPDSLLVAPTKLSYDTAGLDAFFAILRQHGVQHVAFEATGGYERRIFAAVVAHGLTPHLMEPRSIQELARSSKLFAKTDKLDCAKIARAFVVHKPRPSYLCSQAESLLKELCIHRTQLVRERVRAKNQDEKRQHTFSGKLPEFLKAATERRIKHLNEEIELAEEQIVQIVKSDERLLGRVKLMMTMPGMGLLSSALVLGHMPELGTMTNKQCAMLAGLAPVVEQSGQMSRTKRPHSSRCAVKNALWMASLSTVRHDAVFKDFYEKLVNKGKDKTAARVAVMRRMLCALNAMLRDEKEYNQDKVKARNSQGEIIEPKPLKGEAKEADKAAVKAKRPTRKQRQLAALDAVEEVEQAGQTEGAAPAKAEVAAQARGVKQISRGTPSRQRGET